MSEREHVFHPKIFAAGNLRGDAEEGTAQAIFSLEKNSMSQNMIKIIGVTVSKHDNKIVSIMQYYIDKTQFSAIFPRIRLGPILKNAIPNPGQFPQPQRSWNH